MATLRTAFTLVAAAARRELVITFVLTLVASAAVALELVVIRQVVEQVTSGSGDASDLVPSLGLLGVSMVVIALANTAVNELRALLSELVQREAMRRLLEVATAVELESFEDPRFHDRIQRAREHAESAAWSVVWGVVGLVTATVSVVAVSIVLFSVAPLLVLVAVLAFLPLAVVATVNTRLLHRMEYELAEIDRDREYHARLMTGRLEAKEVRAFGLAPWLLRRYDALFAQRIRHTRTVVRQRVVRALLGSALNTMVLVTALGVVATLVLNDRVSVSSGAVAVLALQQIGGRLRGIGDALTSLVEGVTFLREFESLRAPRPASPPSVTLHPAPRRIELERVSYVYPTSSEPAIRDVSIVLEPGKVVALVGPNGSGKSTLAKVLCGLLPPTAGRVTWDGVDITACGSTAWRRLVAPVFQDFTRYEHRADESIAFGAVGDDPGAGVDHARVVVAAEQAGADEFLRELPRGYSTRLSTAYTDGTDLSVGQWQRIAIARAFYRDAPLVVMDEPASSLDPRAEQSLIGQLLALGAGRMVVFVSHRFSSVQHAHEIAVMVDGRIVERGAHDDLMRLDGIYAEMWRLQRGAAPA